MSHTAETVPRRRFERGQGLVSYALITMLVGIAVLAALTVFSGTVKKKYCQIVGQITGELPETCQEISVSCNLGSVTSSGVVLEAVVSDTAGDDDIKDVKFYVDGIYVRTERQVKYCLGGTNGPCPPQSMSKGKHKITAVAIDGEDNSGQCEVSVTVP